jgi:GT2 family glycosyltransferase
VQTEQGRPALSVILATPDTYETIRETVRHLRAQTAKDRLELVMVAPSRELLCLNVAEVLEFHCFQVVELGTIRSIGQANAAGVRSATAPIVALGEDHAFPAPDWAEALIAAHRNAWAVVGAVIGNANPNGVVSWTDFLIGYSTWLAPSTGGVRDLLPSHNGSYKREILLAYGEKLDAMMDAETVLHWDLHAQGHRLYLDPSARVFHMNFGTLTSMLPAQFLSGLVFAASRKRSWTPLRRLGYILGSPLIPVIRFRRILEQTRQSEHWNTLPLGVLPMLGIALAASGLGEMLGYAVGAGEAAKRKLAGLEFHRIRHQPRRYVQALLRESNGTS